MTTVKLKTFDQVVDETRAIREGDYDNPKRDFERLRLHWTLLLRGAGLLTEDQEVPLRLVAPMMVCVKINRESFSHKRDNGVDVSGYAKAGDKALYDDKE